MNAILEGITCQGSGSLHEGQVHVGVLGKWVNMDDLHQSYHTRGALDKQIGSHLTREPPPLSPTPPYLRGPSPYHRGPNLARLQGRRGVGVGG